MRDCGFSGTLQVDVTSGTFESSGLNIVFPGLPAFDTLVSSASQSVGWLILADNSEGDELHFFFGTLPTMGSLVGLTGGIIGGVSVEDLHRRKLATLPGLGCS
jgi:hypothetical protein